MIVPTMTPDMLQVLFGLRPTSVDRYRKALYGQEIFGMPQGSRSNIAYNLQYLEFLEYLLSGSTLHNVLRRSLCKTYVITSIAILECLFYHILKSNGKIKSTNWEPLYDSKDIKTFYDNGTKKKLVISTEKWCDEPQEKKPNFDKMLGMILSGKYLSTVFSERDRQILKNLKHLRNKIHLYYTCSDKDTDFFNFMNVSYIYMKYFLFLILSDKAIQSPNCHVFSEICTQALGVVQQYELSCAIYCKR